MRNEKVDRVWTDGQTNGQTNRWADTYADKDSISNWSNKIENFIFLENDFLFHQKQL